MSVVLREGKIGFEVMFIRRDDLLHEEQVAIQVVGEEEDGKEMEDVGLDELFRFRPLFVVLVCLLGNQTILCGDGEVAHCEMKDLA